MLMRYRLYLIHVLNSEFNKFHYGNVTGNKEIWQ